MSASASKKRTLPWIRMIGGLPALRWRSDAPYFTMDRFTGTRPYTAPRQVLTVWRDEFDAAYADGGLFQLTMHPHVIGHRSRMAILAELVSYIKGHPGVWFATHADIATAVLAG